MDPHHQVGLASQDYEDMSLEEIYLFTLPIKESETIDFFLATSSKMIPVLQNQICAGQQTRLKVFVSPRVPNGHAGLGVKCSKEVATGL